MRKHFSLLLLSMSTTVFAANRTLGEVFLGLSQSFPDIAKLIIAVSYVAGVGFGIAAVYKFKQYKDNPTQIPVGTPIALLVVSVLLVFMPAIVKPAAKSLFGTDTGAAGLIPDKNSCLPGHIC